MQLCEPTPTYRHHCETRDAESAKRCPDPPRIRCRQVWTPVVCPSCLGHASHPAPVSNRLDLRSRTISIKCGSTRWKSPWQKSVYEKEKEDEVDKYQWKMPKKCRAHARFAIFLWTQLWQQNATRPRAHDSTVNCHREFGKSCERFSGLLLRTYCEMCSLYSILRSLDFPWFISVFSAAACAHNLAIFDWCRWWLAVCVCVWARVHFCGLFFITRYENEIVDFRINWCAHIGVHNFQASIIK